jgi:hypothetical protein
MPVAARRFVYSLLAALGFAIMVPFLVAMRRFQSALLQVDPMDMESVLDPLGASFSEGPVLLFLIGLIVASGFLYLALSTGHPRAWRPRENGSPRCMRCGAELRFGLPRCPTCEQQLAW